MRGTVKWFSPQKGYGFIVGDNDKEYFVHHSSISMDGYKTLKTGQPVSFDIEKNDRGEYAGSVCLV